MCYSCLWECACELCGEAKSGRPTPQAQQLPRLDLNTNKVVT